MAKRYNSQDESEGYQRRARAQPQNYQGPGNQLDQRDSDADGPEGPHRQEGVSKGQEIFSRVFQRTQLENFPDAGHEKDQAHDKSREKQSPTTVEIAFLIGVHSWSSSLDISRVQLNLRRIL